jgi:hypothetical protein
MITNVAEEPAASIFRKELKMKAAVSSEVFLTTKRLHGVKTQNATHYEFSSP